MSESDQLSRRGCVSLGSECCACGAEWSRDISQSSALGSGTDDATAADGYGRGGGSSGIPIERTPKVDVNGEDWMHSNCDVCEEPLETLRVSFETPTVRGDWGEFESVVLCTAHAVWLLALCEKIRSELQP